MRGLKLELYLSRMDKSKQVAPFMGAWIEIGDYRDFEHYAEVAPFMGAWIEITPQEHLQRLLYVAPFMGAWIEILSSRSPLSKM